MRSARRLKLGRKAILTGAVTAAIGFAGATAAVGAWGGSVTIDGGISLRSANLKCPGGMVRLGHVFDANASIYPGDPVPTVEQVATVPVDGFLLEKVTTGTHTGTHLSAPGHFLEGATTVDKLPAEDFAWPVRVIDVRQRVANAPEFQVSINDIRAFEHRHGRIPEGALVVLYTGFQDKFGTPAFLDAAPGFSEAAINFLFDNREIKAVGSDTFGPDASSDVDLLASTAVYAHGGVTIEVMAGLDQLNPTGDIVMAPTTALRDGSGFLTDPLGCRRS